MKILLLFIAVYFCTYAFARESLGQLQIVDLLVKSQFTVQELNKGEFNFDQTSFYLNWENESGLKAKVGIGNYSLLNKPEIFNPATEDGITLIEGYVQLKDHWGELQMGLQPVNFGASGRKYESELILNRGFLYSKKIVALRDLGLRYSVSHNGFYTSLFVHNGEAYQDLDDELWFTSEWGWQNVGNLDVGVAAQTGQTTANSTSSSSTEILEFDISKNAKWRMGQIFAHWTPNQWEVQLEFSQLELEQENNISALAMGLFSIGYKENQNWRYDFRYEFYDPNKNSSADQLNAIDLALTYQSRWGNSRLSFIYTHNFEEANELDNNVYSLVWQMTPFANY